MDMNWKRGLIRAWVVASVAWLVVAGFLFGPGAFSSLPQLPETEMIEKSVELARAYRSGTMPTEKKPYYEEALRRGLLIEIRPISGKKDEVEIVLKDQTVITNVPSDIEAKEIGRRISNFFQDTRSKELRSRILETGVWLFIPPAVSLVMGMGMYWVVTGFKKGT
jgi:hypothetical protein